MRILLDRTGSLDALDHTLRALDDDPSVHGILLLACDENGFAPTAVDPILRRTEKPLLGGVFPQILHDGEHLRRGTLALGLPVRPTIAVLEGMSEPALALEPALERAFPDGTGGAERTLLVIVDGFAARIGALIDALFNTFGLDLNYIGGGAGSLSLVPGPSVLTPKGMLADAAVLGLLDLASAIGVAHGWQPISAPLKVTASKGNVIESLDWRPALDAYRELVEAHAGARLDPDDFFGLAKAYPFGIAKLGSEMVVRDPLMPRGDTLVCVGEVPQGSFVRVLHGDEQSLLAAAAGARDAALTTRGKRPVTARLFIDCVSRVLFLEDRFALELEAVRDPAVPLVGALTLGEIANSGREYLEFYNKTAVVGLL